ncbi:MAG TPA: RNA methyltransferase, partial [Burkholderiaceae bacterium]|nr:RNA methyltransferase [Burkholderiaceae bacterium]
CDPFSRRVLRVSMGAALRVPILQATDALAELKCLQNHWGVEAIATVLDSDAEQLQSAQAGDRLALVFGAEASGLPQEWIEACDRRVAIPMAPGTDSLNVATATGIFLYHFASFQNPKRATSNHDTPAAER